jgi:hypothetical protein
MTKSKLGIRYLPTNIESQYIKRIEELTGYKICKIYSNLPNKRIKRQLYYFENYPTHIFKVIPKNVRSLKKMTARNIHIPFKMYGNRQIQMKGVGAFICFNEFNYSNVDLDRFTFVCRNISDDTPHVLYINKAMLYQAYQKLRKYKLNKAQLLSNIDSWLSIKNTTTAQSEKEQQNKVKIRLVFPITFNITKDMSQEELQDVENIITKLVKIYND